MERIMIENVTDGRQCSLHTNPPRCECKQENVYEKLLTNFHLAMLWYRSDTDNDFQAHKTSKCVFLVT
jgi:hypothetical protein